MKKSTRTIYGALVQAAHRNHETLPILPNSTLNQKFDVFKDELPTATQLPLVDYLAIGIKGAKVEIGVNGLYKTTHVVYEPNWGALLHHIPFIMRPVTDDLTAEVRAKYRMRKVMEVNGVFYACYYLLKLDLTTNPLKVQKRVTVNGQVTPSDWVPTLADLNPPMPTTTSQDAYTTGNDYLAATKLVVVPFTPADIQELMNCCNILYGDPGYAIIQEAALVSGIERTLTGDFNGTPRSYQEVIYAQCSDFVHTFLSAPNALDGSKLTLDIGSNEPLIIRS